MPPLHPHPPKGGGWGNRGEVEDINVGLSNLSPIYPKTKSIEI